MGWESNFLFRGLNAAQLSTIGSYVKPVSYSPGTVIMKEGEQGDFMLLIEEGSVDIYKGELKLAQQGAGDLVGLMALIDGAPRSATVVAGTDGVRSYRVDRSAWQKIISGDIRASILNNYLVYQHDTLRVTDEKRLAEAREKWKEEHMRVLSARFFVEMVIGLIIFTFALGTLSNLAKQGESTFISFGLLFVYAAWSYYFVRRSGLPSRAFGLTMDNFRTAMPFALWTTALFIAGMVVFRWITITWFPGQFGTDMVPGYRGTDSMPVAVLIVLYAIHAIMQEFIARACIQGGLHQFITGRLAAVTAIFLATMMFSVFHLMMDMRFALLTIIPGLFWGYLFYRERNILAVAVSHILIGVVAIFVLGIVG